MNFTKVISEVIKKIEGTSLIFIHMMTPNNNSMSTLNKSKTKHIFEVDRL